MRYAAFLRGINVGGNVVIKMADLKRVFDDMGFGPARTILASGNVVFDAERTSAQALGQEIAAGLKTRFGRDITATVRSIDALGKLARLQPFKDIEVTPSIRLYVTFLDERRAPKSISIPYASPDGDFRILDVTGTEVLSVLDLAKGSGTPKAMEIVEKEFGHKVTTRNWNTALKILK
jgi:uncharacterized protein (DUF1697 family)